jgi:hypothetical protein
MFRALPVSAIRTIETGTERNQIVHSIDLDLMPGKVKQTGASRAQLTAERVDGRNYVLSPRVRHPVNFVPALAGF